MLFTRNKRLRVENNELNIEGMQRMWLKVTRLEEKITLYKTNMSRNNKVILTCKMLVIVSLERIQVPSYIMHKSDRNDMRHFWMIKLSIILTKYCTMSFSLSLSQHAIFNILSRLPFKSAWPDSNPFLKIGITSPWPQLSSLTIFTALLLIHLSSSVSTIPSPISTLGSC